MPKRNGHVPSYRLHKPSGLARVIVNGEHIYLGQYGSAESREKYARLIAEMSANRDSPAAAPTNCSGHQAISINEILLAYGQFAETYYCKDGEPTKELECMREALFPLYKLYGTTKAVDFGHAVSEGRSPAHDQRAEALPQRGQSARRTHQAGLQVGRRRRTGAAINVPRFAGTGWLTFWPHRGTRNGADQAGR